ncbi:MAG: hypothetical protein O3B08_16200 [Proteobacteria bacterium]|nr:hypothetical protein [Pseudomonadota bacterium]
MKPIRDAIDGFDVEELVRKRADEVFKNIKWVSSSPIAIQTGQLAFVAKELSEKSKKPAIGIITPTYRMSSDFLLLNICIGYALYPASSKMQSIVNSNADDPKPFFTTHGNAEAKVDGGIPGNMDVNSAKWAADGGKNIRQALEDSVLQAVDRLQLLLQHPTFAKDK